MNQDNKFQNTKNRVLVFGLDGLYWEILIPWINEGHLPNFQKIIREGAYGGLLSTIPYYTAPAWLSMMTGKNPGKLGVYYFRQPDNDYNYKNIDLNFEFAYPFYRRMFFLMGVTMECSPCDGCVALVK